MNSQTLKTVSLYAGGALVGAAMGAIIGSLIVDQILAAENGPVQVLEEEAAEEESEDPDSRPTLLKRPPKDRKMVKIDYTKFTKDDKGGPDQLTELVQKYAKAEETEDSLDMSRPYVISIEDFNEGGENNSKVTLTYYDSDDVLCQPDDTPIPEVEKLIGTDSLTKFGMNSDDVDVVYVRNTNISADFEVIRVHSSYSHTVLGVPLEEKPVKKAKKQDEDSEE
ncbi:TPA: hypothetical protein DCQ22_04020 [Candidatus Nomurabacteria bacterium]|nr:hypothetical protein [Candidatus Nomurabacteria bacterium]